MKLNKKLQANEVKKMPTIIVISQTQIYHRLLSINKIVAYEAENMPLLPPAIRERLLNTGLEFEQVTIILDEPVLAEIILYISEAHDQKTAKTIANWSLGELQRLCINNEISW